MSSRRRRKRGGGNKADGNRADGNRADGNRADGNNTNGNRADGNNANGNNANNNGNRTNNRKKNSGKNASGKNNSGKGGSGKKGGRQKNKPKTPKFDAADFWGDNELLPDPRGYEVHLDDTTAILRSLGRPPIPGSEAAAEHHFAMVYDRSVNMARALAAAGGLDQEIDEDEDAEASGD